MARGWLPSVSSDANAPVKNWNPATLEKHFVGAMSRDRFRTRISWTRFSMLTFAENDEVHESAVQQTAFLSETRYHALHQLASFEHARQCQIKFRLQSRGSILNILLRWHMNRIGVHNVLNKTFSSISLQTSHEDIVAESSMGEQGASLFAVAIQALHIRGVGTAQQLRARL